MNDDIRIFMALRFNVGNGSLTQQREFLETKAWLVFEAFRVENLYVSMSSFPLWSHFEDMGDFGMIQPLFPVNTIDCVCAQVQPSPLRESFADSISLAGGSLKCRDLVADYGGLSTIRTNGTNVSKAEAWKPCLEEFRRAPITRSMTRVLGIEEFNQGILLLSISGTPSELAKGRLRDKLFLFWVNLLSPEPEEFGFVFGKNG